MLFEGEEGISKRTCLTSIPLPPDARACVLGTTAVALVERMEEVEETPERPMFANKHLMIHICS